MESVESLLQAAHADFLAGKLPKAIKKYTEALKSKSNEPIILVNRAVAHLRLKLLKHVIRDCDAALAIDKQCLRAYLIKGKALQQLSREEEALVVWRTGTAGASCVDIVILEELNNHIKSRNEPVHLDQATDVDSAASIVAKKGLVQHGVGNSSVDGEIAKGYLLVNTGKLDEAIALFKRVIESNPTAVGAFLGKGTAEALGGHLMPAIREFTAGIKINPNIADAWKRRGQARAAMGDDKGAIADLSHALSIDRDDDCLTVEGVQKV